MSRAHRPIRRITALAAACVGAAFLLTACIDVNADITVNSDATGSGTFEMVLQKEAASMLGVTSADQLASQISGDETGVPGLSDCKAGETDAGYTYSCSFTNTAFTDATGPWTITKSGESIVFTIKGNAAADASAESGDMSELLGGASLGTMTIKVAFPGPISQMTGEGVTKTSDTSATITSDLSETVDVTITAESSAGGGLSASMIIVLLVALAVIVLIIVVAIVMIRRRSKPTGPPIAAPGNPNAAQVVADATATTALTGPLVTEAASVAVVEPVEVVEETAVVEPVEVVEETAVVEPVEVVEETAVVEDAPEDPQAPPQA